VVRRMFPDVEADVYLMTDGDATYDARFAPQLVDKLLRDNLKVVWFVKTEKRISGTVLSPRCLMIINRLSSKMGITRV